MQRDLHHCPVALKGKLKLAGKVDKAPQKAKEQQRRLENQPVSSSGHSPVNKPQDQTFLQTWAPSVAAHVTYAHVCVTIQSLRLTEVQAPGSSPVPRE